MPVHEYVCDGNHAFEKVRRFGDDVAVARCPECGGMGYKQWNPPQVRPDIEPHWSEQLGVHIKSRRNEREHIARIEGESMGQIKLDWH